MNEEMKQALLECCERNCEVLTPAVLAFAKDLVNTAIKVSDTPIDDMFLPIIPPACTSQLLVVNAEIFPSFEHSSI